MLSSGFHCGSPDTILKIRSGFNSFSLPQAGDICIHAGLLVNGGGVTHTVLSLLPSSLSHFVILKAGTIVSHLISLAFVNSLVHE